MRLPQQVQILLRRPNDKYEREAAAEIQQEFGRNIGTYGKGENDMADDKKAFLLADFPVRKEKWNSVSLNCGKYLSWGRKLRVAYSKNRRVALIGECWSIQDGMTPQEQIDACDENPVEGLLALEQYWNGRYLLIIDDTIYMDMSGLLCLFYNERYCSNDLNLILEYENLSCKKEKIRHGLMPDYVPGSMTQYPGIFRLLPSQTYDFIHHQCKSRPMLKEQDFTGDKMELTRMLIEAFDMCFRNMAEHFEGKKLLLALTGGYDSRTVCALMEHAGIPFETYLLLHDDISSADVALSKRLSEQLQKKAHFVPQEKERFSKEREREFDRFVANYHVDRDRLYYAYGQYDQLKEEVGSDIVLVRGGLWSCADEGCYGWIDLDEIDMVLPIIRFNKTYQESMRQWRENIVRKDTFNTNISAECRLYWEIRSGCWLSSIERSFDLYEGITSVHPINCRYLMGLLMMYAKEERKGRQHQRYIVSRACPELSEIPYDKQMSKTGRDRRIRYCVLLERMLWIAKEYGLPSVAVFIKNQKENKKRKNERQARRESP